MPKPIAPIINWNNPITRGLIAHWPLAEKANTIAKDIVGGKNGTLSGDYSWYNEIWGINVKFAGSTGKMSVTNNATFDIASGAVVFFFKTSQSASDIIIHARHNSSQSNGGFTLFLASATGFITAQIKKTDATLVSNPVGTVNLRDGNLHMGVMNFGQANGFTNAIYIDGKLAGSATNSAAWTWGSNNIVWARGDDAFWTKLNGAIGPSSWYSRLLTPTEILSLYVNPFQIYRAPLPMPLNSGIYI